MRTVSFRKDGPYVGHGIAVVVMPECSKGDQNDCWPSNLKWLTWRAYEVPWKSQGTEIGSNLSQVVGRLPTRCLPHPLLHRVQQASSVASNCKHPILSPKSKGSEMETTPFGGHVPNWLDCPSLDVQYLGCLWSILIPITSVTASYATILCPLWMIYFPYSCFSYFWSQKMSVCHFIHISLSYMTSDIRFIWSLRLLKFLIFNLVFKSSGSWWYNCFIWISFGIGT